MLFPVELRRQIVKIALIRHIHGQGDFVFAAFFAAFRFFAVFLMPAFLTGLVASKPHRASIGVSGASDTGFSALLLDFLVVIASAFYSPAQTLASISTWFLRESSVAAINSLARLLTAGKKVVD